MRVSQRNRKTASDKVDGIITKKNTSNGNSDVTLGDSSTVSTKTTTTTETDKQDTRANVSKNSPDISESTDGVNGAAGTLDDQVTSTQASDHTETLYIPSDYDGDLQSFLEKRYREMTKKNTGKDIFVDRDDSISTSETRAAGDTRTPSASDTMSKYHQVSSHDGLPAFPAPPGYMGSATHYSSVNDNAELTADGAGFVLEQDQSAVPPSFAGPQHPEQPEVPSHSLSDDSNSNGFLRPTEVIYHEVTVPVPVPFPVHEEVSVPVEQSDASVASSLDTASEAPNLTFGARHTSLVKEASADAHLHHHHRGRQQEQSSPLAFQANGQQQQQQRHMYNRYNAMNGVNKDHSQMNRHVSQSEQGDDAANVNYDANGQSLAVAAAAAAAAGHVSPYELQYSPINSPSPHSNQHVMHAQQQQPYQQQSLKNRVNSLIRSLGKTSERSPQPSVAQQVQLNAPIAQMTQAGAAASFLPHTQMLYESNGPTDPVRKIPASNTQVKSVQRHTRIPLTPAAIAAAASGTRQRLPVFIKSSATDKLAAPSMPRAHFHTAAAPFEQETIHSKASFVSPDSASAAPSASLDTLQSQVKTSTGEMTDYAPIPLGLPVGGLLLRRQQQQHKHKHDKEHLKAMTSQAEASMHQPVISSASLQYLPSPPGPPSPIEETAVRKSSLAHRLTAKILAEQLLDFERSSSKASSRMRRDTHSQETDKKEQLDTAASRYYGHPFDDDSFGPNVGAPLFHVNPDYHTGSSRRRSQQVRRGPRRNINPTGAESAKSYGILGSGNFEVIRGGIYKESDLDNHQEHTQGGSNRHHHRHHHNQGGDDYDDASNKKYIPFDPHGEDDDNSRDPVFGFQGYDNFQLASNQEEDLRKSDDKSHSQDDHTAAASFSSSSVAEWTKSNRNSLIDSDDDLMAIA